MATVTLLTEESVAVLDSVTEMNHAIPVGKRFISVSMIRLDPGDEVLGINDVLINGAIITVYFNGSDTAPGQHELFFVWGEDIDVTETVTTLVDNLDGTYTYTSEDATETIVNTVQELAIDGNVIQITNGNAITLPTEFASEEALTKRVANLEKCVANFCKRS